jgi:pseudouridine synthase
VSIRLHKLIAASGLASRREAERWIEAGRVSVNGEVMTEQGLTVDPASDRIEVDGRPLPSPPESVTYAFYKPRNVVVARRDPQGRPIIYDYLATIKTLVHPVGRLDFDSEGLLILSNDGDLIERLSHPRGEVSKTYHVKVKGQVAKTALRRLEAGVQLEDGPAQALSARCLKTNPHNTWLEIVVAEGRNRLVRRMCDSIEHPVLRLKRVAIGAYALGTLKPGHTQALSRRAIQRLQESASENDLSG